jgi:hypothetical protein
MTPSRIAVQTAIDSSASLNTGKLEEICDRGRKTLPGAIRAHLEEGVDEEQTLVDYQRLFERGRYDPAI